MIGKSQNQLGGGNKRRSRLSPRRHPAAFIITIATLAITLIPLATHAVQNIFTGFGQITDIQFQGQNIDKVVYQGVTIWERCQQFSQSLNYTGSTQTFTAECGGYYQIELWGASGGSDGYVNTDGKGAYTKGTIYLAADATLYTYVGQKPTTVSGGGWNGGGNAPSGDDPMRGSGGGGATDIRLSSGSWNDVASLRSRIMVAAGGGGSSGWPMNANTGSGGDGGGLIGYNGALGTSPAGATDDMKQPTGGTQVSGGISPTDGVNSGRYGNPGTFGFGGFATQASNGYGGGAGSGYYGGAGGAANSPACGAGAGGSSYISGHTGAVAITSATNQSPKSGCTTGTTTNSCSTHYSGKTFTNTIMIDGAGYNWTNTKGALTPMPTPSGTTYPSGTGHTGNGAARITYLGANPS